VPTPEENYVGKGDYLETGRLFLGYFRQWANLERNERVLDVGCGIGRMATPLTEYLTHGHYDGIDVVPHAIVWCQRHISSRYPRFRFQLIDVRNGLYNASGQIDAAKYRFPFGHESFDFVFLASVFTHMLPAEIDNYLAEVSRVLRPAGRSFISYFLLNDVSRANLGQARSTLVFQPSAGVFRTTAPETPESAVAFEEDYVRSLYRKHGLVSRPTLYGKWCGRRDGLDYQDFIVAEKTVWTAGRP
jgi:ubiquinone/menaquinone biosynthesis C-methylase UbiE